MKSYVLLSTALFLCETAFGHEVKTHIKISAQAVTYLQKPNVDPHRPDFSAMNTQLRLGAIDEDSFFGILGTRAPLGRFFFHFLPNLNNSDQQINASCNSIDWGFGNDNGVGVPCRAQAGIFFTTQQNTHGYQNALQGADRGRPTDQGWNELGYVVHLLEDVTSPAHTRNDPHPCTFRIFQCDKFERFNDDQMPNLPSEGSLLGAPDPSTLRDPRSFFLQLEPFIQANFFSSGTVFSPNLPQPGITFQDNQYFYGQCLGTNDPACSGGLRKLASKGLKYKLTGDKTMAIIDDTIAGEQFKELGPIAVQYVGAFLQLYAPTITVVPAPESTGTGTVTSSPQGIDCGTICLNTFVNGTDITLSALPDPGATVTWGGDCSGTALDQQLGSIAVKKSCTARFDLITFALTKGGSGSGTVTSIPAGVNCGATCGSQTAPLHGSVQLVAVPTTGSTFTAWSGDCAGTAPTITLNITANMSCIAAFDLITLTVTKIGNGVGSLTSSPSGIDCGVTCATQTAPLHGPVQLTAVPATGSTFQAWGGDCSGTAATTTVDITANKTCTSSFAHLPSVRVNPFASHNLSEGPFNVEAVSLVNSQLTPVPAPADITTTLLREVISVCRGTLFSSPRTIMIPQGQTLAGGLDAAGRDPACNTLPITTRWTVLQAIEAPNVNLDLSVVPREQLTVSIVR